MSGIIIVIRLSVFVLVSLLLTKGLMTCMCSVLKDKNGVTVYITGVVSSGYMHNLPMILITLDPDSL